MGLLARRVEGLNAAKKEVKEFGEKALVVVTDVAKADEVEEAAKKLKNILEALISG